MTGETRFMTWAVVLALLLSAAPRSSASEASHVQLSGAAGLQLGGGLDSAHLAAGLSYSVKPWLSLGADFGYSYLPLAAQARGGGNRAYWALGTVSAAARPTSSVSPYVLAGYGLGRYQPSASEAESGKALALGAGANVRLGPRASLFIESRLTMLSGITATDGLHAELPVTIGIRFRP